MYQKIEYGKFRVEVYSEFGHQADSSECTGKLLFCVMCDRTNHQAQGSTIAEAFARLLSKIDESHLGDTVALQKRIDAFKTARANIELIGSKIT